MFLQFGFEYVCVIVFYVVGKLILEVVCEFGFDVVCIVKLVFNENLLGMLQLVKNVMVLVIDELVCYLDVNGFSLKVVLYVKFGVLEVWIMFGNGSNDIFELVVCVLVLLGQVVMYVQYLFVVYVFVVQEVGVCVIEVLVCDYGYDFDVMVVVIMLDMCLIYIVNLNNLIGIFLFVDDIVVFFVKVLLMVVVVLDEVYNEFFKLEQQYDFIVWVCQYLNLFVLWMFFKVYGLVGLCVGYGIVQLQLIDLFNCICQLFNVNSLVQVVVVVVFNDV